MTQEIIQGDCLEVMRRFPDRHFDLVLTDPPYFEFKTDDWDNQWESEEAFLEWVGRVCVEVRRVLKVNGSMYFFCSPRMASKVENEIGKHFRVLNHIVWQKEKNKGKHKAISKDIMRSYFPNTERIIFCEQFGVEGAENFGYNYSSGLLHSKIAEPIKKYLNEQRELVGLSIRDIDTALNTKMAHHWFSHPSQWTLPTRENYAKIQELFRSIKSFALEKEYDELRAQYDELRKEYLRLRRTFQISPDEQYTDVWDFGTVPYKAGKHPTEKPIALMRHMISVSSKEEDRILDPFAGSGSTLVAAKELGREAVGIELSSEYCKIAQERLSK